MAADLNSVKLHINHRGQKLHSSPVVTIRFPHSSWKVPRPSPLSYVLKKIFIEVSSFHCFCSVSKMEESACQTFASLFGEQRLRVLSQSMCIFCMFVWWVIYRTISAHNKALNKWIMIMVHKSPSLNDTNNKRKELDIIRLLSYKGRKQVRTKSALCYWAFCGQH